MSKSTLLDSTDRKLLSLLQVDASAPTKSLAAKVGLSTTACWNRIRQLEENGVITGRVALVDPAKLGVGLTDTVGNIFVELVGNAPTYIIGFETGDFLQDVLP